jgi:hypothetical protein
MKTVLGALLILIAAPAIEASSQASQVEARSPRERCVAQAKRIVGWDLPVRLGMLNDLSRSTGGSVESTIQLDHVGRLIQATSWNLRTNSLTLEYCESLSDTPDAKWRAEMSERKTIVTRGGGVRRSHL